jgi:5,10-methylene-tetrahydrofolate dehydrogenase/methenyl tetrahydrofolate cyclohydrolase
MPVALLLVRRDATVTICHSRTRDLPGVVRQADILIAAVGRAQMVKGDWIKPGAIIIDVGTNQVDDPTAKNGHRLVGDVDFEAAKQVAGAITPVPGGVGPMTIAMLLQNTLHAAELAQAALRI